jgi:hypothetical protein
MGIEPTSPAWKAGALPLCYARIECARQSTLAVGEASRVRPLGRCPNLNYYRIFQSLKITHPRTMKVSMQSNQFPP